MSHKRCPDRFRDLPGAGLGAFAVTVHGLVATGGGKFVGSFPQDDVDAGICRPDEGCQQLRRRTDATPMGGRQQVDLDGLLGEHHSVSFDPYTQFAAPRGIDASEKGGIKLQIETANVVNCLVRDALDAPNSRRDEWRLRCQVDRNSRNIGAQSIFDCEVPDDRNSVLIERNVDVIRRDARNFYSTGNHFLSFSPVQHGHASESRAISDRPIYLAAPRAHGCGLAASCFVYRELPDLAGGTQPVE
ncbi:hypothetical protein [Bradyrhizobium sp. CB3481]|uniref:hypothetical protein n=1 Tax=Bradyrhizobium sp. CB3481 TaxID=3039158 RepID=UPI0024B21A53|nr:hypothetical protein [Bradyrhizobium sp. CB3481]WFU20789.1 hypothetical protein QA643_36850 [Bradyrhizobium sp. CB3481]